MVEFGAGGKVARRDENVTTATEDTAAGTPTVVPGSAAATGSSVPNPAPSGGTTTTGRERRKRKPKGWYCPVCRQPYTSLLRLALPANDATKPLDAAIDVELARAPSRASVRTTASRRAPSIAPTLPDGAERMLDSLRPAHARGNDDDDDDDNVHVHDHDHAHAHTHDHDEAERPQFILGGEEENKAEKAEIEHREALAPPIAESATSGAFDNAQASEEGRNNTSKGWKEASHA